MKYILCILLSMTVTFTRAQDLPKKPAITRPSEREAAKSSEQMDMVKYLISFLPILGAIVALYGVFYQIRARRRDDMLKNQLDRLNTQISDFYGPMYSLYETGHRNYYNYLSLNGEDVTFSNPNFNLWLRNVFEPTNNGMESIIIDKADLILGRDIPNHFLQFCKWAALMKVYNKAQRLNGFNNDNWKPVLQENQHPEVNMQSYLRASFEVLKEAQSDLLSGSRNYVDEKELIVKINRRTDEYIKDYRKPDSWESQIRIKAREIDSKKKRPD